MVQVQIKSLLGSKNKFQKKKDIFLYKGEERISQEKSSLGNWEETNW